jgi:predicted RNA-binding Zn-ribbon protein involved in translation (DUF1610 family)
VAKPQNRKPRILLWDIETTHNLVATFRLFGEDYIPHQNLIQERYIVCAAWKWLGESKVHTVATTDNPELFAKDPHNDLHVVQTLQDVLSEADVIVHHNGDTYDIKFFRGRSLYHQFPPIPPFKSVDTKKIAKQHFMFNSNRLDYLGQFLGVGRKADTRTGLWLDVLKGSKKAIKEMVTYNKQDVLLLEDIFLKLMPYVTNINQHLFGATEGCPRCGSLHIQSRGVHRAEARTYQRFQCQECGGWFKHVKADKTPKVLTRTL